MHISDRIAFIELFWTVVIGLGLVTKILNFIDAQKDLKALESTGRNGFRMKLAMGARDTDFLRAFSMFFLWIPGVISLFAMNPVNRDPVPWYSYATITCLIVAGVILTVVSIRARYTRKAVILESMKVPDVQPFPEEEIRRIAHETAEEGADRVIDAIDLHNHTPLFPDAKLDSNSEETREGS